MINQQDNTPAGFKVGLTEFVAIDGDVFFFQDRQMVDFRMLPTDRLNLVRIDMESNPAAMVAFENIGITDPAEMLKQYLICNFGNFDNRADITEDGILIKEHVTCSARGNCKHEGTLCQHFFPAPNGNLTQREIEIVKMIATDQPDKIIAYRLGIEVTTMATHRKHIEQKIGCATKVGITRFACEHNIL